MEKQIGQLLFSEIRIDELHLNGSIDEAILFCSYAENGKIKSSRFNIGLASLNDLFMSHGKRKSILKVFASLGEKICFKPEGNLSCRIRTIIGGDIVFKHLGFIIDSSASNQVSEARISSFFYKKITT